MTEPVYVGVDAGGTKTALLAARGDETVARTGPGAQALRDGPDAAAATVAELVGQAQDAAGAPVAGLAVGMAGAGRGETRAALAEALRRRFAGAAVRVVHDAEVAYHAAWGDESGALLIVGTGSLVFARDGAGRALRAGGWGTALGDDGGGTALGRAALRVLLAALDGGPPSALPAIAAEARGLVSADDVFEAVYARREPLGSFAGLALAAVEAGDWAAEAALHAEVNALAKQAGWLATRAGETVRQRLAVAGGLAGEPVYRAALDAALGRHLPGWTVAARAVRPAEGALAMARALYQTEDGGPQGGPEPARGSAVRGVGGGLGAAPGACLGT